MSETLLPPTNASPTPLGVFLAALRERVRASDDERAFRIDYVERSLATVRVALIFGIAMVVSVCVLDWMFMPRGLAETTIPFRVTAMILPLAFAVAATYVESVRANLPYLLASAALLVGVSTIVVGGMAAKSGAEFLLWETLFMTFYAYLALGLRLRLGAMAALPLLCAYIGLDFVIAAPLRELAYGILFLGFSNVVGMYASHLLELNARVAFAQEKELCRLARIDGLTGICNRTTFDEHLNSVWRQAHRDNCAVAVLLVDIDFFKLYNDCYGYQEGDKCICAVTDLLAASVNRPLDLVARHGGEEFAIVLYDPDKAFVKELGGQLCKRIHDLEIPHKGSDCAATISVSIGAALVFPREGGSDEQLVRRADDALYEAKDRGRNQAVVYQSDWSDSTSAKLPAIAL